MAVVIAEIFFAYTHDPRRESEILMPDTFADENYQKDRDILLRRIREKCKNFSVLGLKQLSMEKYYQIIPLLKKVKKLPQEGMEVELHEIATRYEPMDIEDLLKKALPGDRSEITPHFVVIGDPGSGKSTLTRYLAWKIASRKLKFAGKTPIPVRISLHQWEKWTAKYQNYGLPEYLAAKTAEFPENPGVAKWRYWLEKGDILILADGLDEISFPHCKFYEQALKKLADKFPRCPQIFTCRQVSYEHYQEMRRENVYLLNGLSKKQQKKYVDQFPPENENDYDPKALWEQISSLPQMQLLAANPLLLSIICYVVDDSEEKVFLPSTRCQLYEKAVNKLLHEHVKIDIEWPKFWFKQDLLEKIALNLFIGNRRGSFTPEEMLDAFRNVLAERNYGEKQINSLLNKFLCNSNILQNSYRIYESSSNKWNYFFLHPTFQEYLIACQLAKLVEDKKGNGWNSLVPTTTDEVSVWTLINHKAWDSAWQGVILFLAGQLTDPHELLAMLSAPEDDDNFHHRLTLAVLCLPEIAQNVRDSCTNLIGEIAAKMFSLWWQYGVGDTLSTILQMSQALSALLQTNPLIWESSMPQLEMEMDSSEINLPDYLPFLDWLTTTLRYSVWAKKVLGKMMKAAVQPKVLQVLIDFLIACLHDSDIWLHRSAAKLLRKMGKAAATPEVLLALADALNKATARVMTPIEEILEITPIEETEETEAIEYMCYAPALVHAWELPSVGKEGYYVQRSIMEALGEMGEAAATPEVLQALSSTLRNTGKFSEFHNDLTLYTLKDMLGEMGEAAVTPEVLQNLIDSCVHAARNNSWKLFEKMNFMLWDMGKTVQSKLVHALIATALRDPNKDVRKNVQEALRTIMNRMGQYKLLRYILAVDLGDPNDDIRNNAEEILEGMRKARRQFKDIRTLIADLHSNFPYLRWNAVIALGNIGKTATQSEAIQAIQALISILHDSSGHMREFVMMMLAEIGEAAVQPDVIKAFIFVLRRGTYEKIISALSALEKMGKAMAHPGIILALLDIYLPGVQHRGHGLYIDQEIYIDKKTGEILRKMREAAEQPGELQLLISALCDSNFTVRKSAANALEKMEKTGAQSKAIQAFITALHDCDENMRRSAAEMLGKMEEAVIFEVIQVLISALCDSDM